MKSVGFLKRMLVVAYDGLLLAGVLFLSALFLPLLPESFAASMPGKLLKSAYLLSVCFIFYGWFWTHGGQTLGMRAWNLYLIKPDGKFIGWKIAAVRFLSAIISWAAVGLGFTWILVNRRGLAWHDIISNTQIVHVTDKARRRS